jgi:hypothetical protein
MNIRALTGAFMSDIDDNTAQRRRFLALTAKLGISVAGMTLALAKPSYAASSGFNAGKGNGSEGGDPGHSGSTPAARVDDD